MASTSTDEKSNSVAIDPKTGLMLSSELIKQLERIVANKETNWVLGMINCDNLKSKNNESYQIADSVIRNVGLEINDLCEQDKNRFKGYKYSNDIGSNDVYSILIDCPTL